MKQRRTQVSEIIDPAKIDLIVANHVEIDHSGGLAGLAKLIPGVPIYCTAAAVTGFGRHYNTEGWNFIQTASGDSVNLGGRTQVFLEAPCTTPPI